MKRGWKLYAPHGILWSLVSDVRPGFYMKQREPHWLDLILIMLTDSTQISNHSIIYGSGFQAWKFGSTYQGFRDLIAPCTFKQQANDIDTSEDIQI